MGKERKGSRVEQGTETDTTAPAPTPAPQVTPTVDLNQFDGIVEKDSHRAFSGKRGGNARYKMSQELLDKLGGYVDQLEKAVLPVEAVRTMTEYKGKATDENFIYGLQEALKRAEKAGLNTHGLRAGIREESKKIVFYHKK